LIGFRHMNSKPASMEAEILNKSETGRGGKHAEAELPGLDAKVQHKAAAVTANPPGPPLSVRLVPPTYTGRSSQAEYVPRTGDLPTLHLSETSLDGRVSDLRVDLISHDGRDSSRPNHGPHSLSSLS
jgi:hypothetical protein